MTDQIPTTDAIRNSFALWQTNTELGISSLTASQAAARTEHYRAQFDAWATENGVAVPETAVVIDDVEVRSSE